MKNIKAITPSILSGIFIGTSYIPFYPWALIFCFVPLWWSWLSPKHSYKKIFLTGWLTQFILTLIGFNWVAFTVHEFGRMPWPVSILGLFLFASLAHLFIPFAGIFSLFLSKRLQIKNQLAILLLFALITFLGQKFFSLMFSWNFAYTWLWADLPLAQMAEWIGFNGLSLLTLCLNALLSFSFYLFTQKASFKNICRPLAMVVTSFVLLNLIGYQLKTRLPADDSRLNFLVVQANIGNLEKQYAEKGMGFRDDIFTQYHTLTTNGLKKHPDTDFVVWPETAFPKTFDIYKNTHPLQIKFWQHINQTQTPHIFGTYGKNEHSLPTNSMFFVKPNLQLAIEARYNKSILLPFGEYFPIINLFPQIEKKIRQYFPTVGRFAPDPGPKVMSLEGNQFGPQICYEGLFPEFTANLANQGAQILVNITNDSWFGLYQEPFQHLYMTVARSIEVRRPLVRSTNTGISVIASEKGEILNQSPLKVKGTYYFSLPFKKIPKTTLYQKFPHIDLFLSLLIFLTLIIIDKLLKPKAF